MASHFYGRRTPRDLDFGKTTLLLYGEWNVVGQEWKQGDQLRGYFRSYERWYWLRVPGNNRDGQRLDWGFVRVLAAAWM